MGISIPRYEIVSEYFSLIFPKWKLSSESRFFPNLMILDLFALNLSLHFSLKEAQVSKRIWSCLSAGLIKIISSAYATIEIFIDLKRAPMFLFRQSIIRSSMKILNKNGERIPPCLTPQVMLNSRCVWPSSIIIR